MSSPLRVVLVDDSQDLRLMLRIRLQSSKALDVEIVGEAADGSEAIEVFEQQRPDVMVLDLAMPRMDGLQAAKRIRELDEIVLLIALTGYTSASVGQEALEAGFNHFLTKGESLRDLEEILLGASR